MRAPLEELLEERELLYRLADSTKNGANEIHMSVGEEIVPASIVGKIRWGLVSYVTMRLREIEHDLKGLQGGVQ